MSEGTEKRVKRERQGTSKVMVIFFFNWVVGLHILPYISYHSEKLIWNSYNMKKVMNTTAVISVMPDYQTLEDTRKVFFTEMCSSSTRI